MKNMYIKLYFARAKFVSFFFAKKYFLRSKGKSS